MPNRPPKKKPVQKIQNKDLFDEEAAAGLAIDNVDSTKVPCSIQGVTSALGGGALGYVFGFGRTLLTSRKLMTLNRAGVESGSTFAVFGGVYAAAACFVSRIRQKDDFWNGGLAGCATGVVVAWKSGPVGTLQSCIGIGVLSALFDVIGKEPTAEAHPLSIYNEACPTQGKTTTKRLRRMRLPHACQGDTGRMTGREGERKTNVFPCRHCRTRIGLLRWL